MVSQSMPSSSSVGAGLLMLIKSQQELSRVCSFIGSLQEKAVKIQGQEVAILFKTRDVTALSKTINSKVGQIINIVA